MIPRRLDWHTALTPPAHRRRRRATALIALAAILVTGCGDFWEEEDEAPPPTVAEEAPDTSRQPAVIVEGSYDSPELGAFSFATNECPFEVDSPVDVDCGTLTVPHDRSDESSGTIEVAVAILRTPSADPADDPVVFLNGGPGGVSLATHWWWINAPGQWRDHPILMDRDLILVDQRGTGYSQPSLNCDEEEFVSDCHDRLVADDIVLASFSTPENAADLASLRLALGYESWNLYGSSYGTRLAMAIVRDHPDGVRSMLLDGVYPLDVVPAYEQYLDNTLGAFGELANLCAQQPACSDAYGDLNELLATALEAVDANADTDLFGVEVFDLIFEAMYSMDSLVDIPLALWLFANDEVDAALDVLDAEPVNGANVSRLARSLDPAADSSGKFYSVECREEHHMTDLFRVEEQAERLSEQGVPDSVIVALYAAVASPVEDVCPFWDSGVAHDDERLPLVSGVPTLLLAGRFDPITPPRWAQIAAANLTASTLVVAPSLSHSSVLEDACIDGIVASFLADPAAGVDTGCVVNMSPPALTLPQ